MSIAPVTEDKTVNYVYLLGGLVSLVFGILLLTRTGAAIEIIMILTGLWWFIHGLFYLLSIFIDRSQWGWKLFGGILGVLAGVLVLQAPLLGGVVVLGVYTIILGIIGIVFGIAALIAAFQGGGWGTAVFGVISIIIGGLLIFNLGVATRVLFTIFAILLIIQGIIAVVAGFMYRE